MSHPYDPEQDVGAQIKRMSHAFAHTFFETARKKGVKEPSFIHCRILDFIACRQEQAVFQRDIEEAFHITRSSVTGLVQLMEKKGYITRQSVPHDARLKQLLLTPLGESVRKQSAEALHLVEQRASQGLSPEELETFRGLCAKIQKNLITEQEVPYAETHSGPDQGL